MSERIEILGLDIFEGLKKEMDTVETVQKFFSQGIGWHYYLDLAWILSEVQKLPKGSLILDAGAGVGLAQFLLSELGYNVISVDFTARRFGQAILKRYCGVVLELNDQSEAFDNRYTRHLEKTYNIGIRKGLAGLGRLFRVSGGGSGARTAKEAAAMIEKKKLVPSGAAPGVLTGDPEKDCGRIFLYRTDLKDLGLIPDSFVDAVVSISALEHNDHNDFEKCIKEIMRVTKPGGKLVATVSASLGDDWFHEPSKGWCYSEASLKKLFRLPDNVQSNYSRREAMFEELKKEGNDLHKRLAPFYFKSGDNGMPWGKWDPQYLPVGVVRTNVKDIYVRQGRP